MKNLGLTRRELITGAAGAAAAATVASIAGCSSDTGIQFPAAGPDVPPGSACGCTPRSTQGAGTAGEKPGEPVPVAGSSKVVVVQRDDSLDGKHNPRIEVVQEMVDTMLKSLSGGADNPWSVLLPGADKCTRIGLKVNCLAPRTPTSPATVLAVVRSLVEKGNFCASNIVIWERLLSELGDLYTEAKNIGARLVGTNDAFGWAEEGRAIQGSGPGYGDPLDGFQGADPAVKPRISKVMTDLTDVTINIPVLKAHPECGFTGALKACYGMFDCPSNFHGPVLQEEMPKLYAIPRIRGSIKLTIMDSLRASVMSNNVGPPDCSPGLIAASLDPLALDTYALDLANQLRTKPKPPGRPMAPVDTTRLRWMEKAYTLGLGAKSYTLVTPGADGDVPVDGGVADADSPQG